MLLRALFLLTTALGALSAQACSIPVFRYALDRWPADRYALEVSAADAPEESVARFLRNWTDSTPLNLSPVRMKEDGPSRLVFPQASPETPAVWSGALEGRTLPQLTDSPARAEIVRGILAGEAGVWLLIESGDRVVDESAAAALQKRLRYLEQVAQLPHIDPSDPTSKLGPGPTLRVGFSLLRISREAAEEQVFLKMLAGPKAQGSIAPGPWLAVVFGRGRVLGAWPADGFGDEQIDEACLFLLGACSCQVKRLNPGWDLLLHADWDEALRAIGYPTAETAATSAPTPPAPRNEPPKPETVVVTAAAPAASDPLRSPSRLGIAAGVLLVLGSALAWRTMRRPS